jgi:hypothetical protein
MAAPESVRVPAIRAAVAAAIERRTLRGVAAEIGMSHTGLMAFVGGGEPRPGTVRKLQAWYVKHAAELGPVDEDAIHAALALLLDGIPERDVPPARERVLAAIRESFSRSGAPRPAWLND